MNTLGIIGYGNQAKSWALNLRDAGWDVTVLLREGSRSRAEVEGEGFRIANLPGGASAFDHLAVLVPDHEQPSLLAGLREFLRPGVSLVFAHGYNVTFRRFPEDLDARWILVAPKAVGTALRANYLSGQGVAGLIGTRPDTPAGWSYAETLARALGCHLGIFRSSFEEETVADLFSEQAILCGGVPRLVQQGFETLVCGGIAPVVAYFECLYELKLITDLMVARGMAGMYEKISPTAKFGGLLAGSRLVNGETVREMERLLSEIRSGEFTRLLDQETRDGFAWTRARLRELAGHPLEAAWKETGPVEPAAAGRKEQR